MVMGLLDQPIQLAILKKRENASAAPQGGKGAWIKNNEVKESNSIDTVFQSETNLSSVELTAGKKADKATVMTGWDTRNTGNVRDSWKEQKGMPAAADANGGVQAPAAVNSLFAGM